MRKLLYSSFIFLTAFSGYSQGHYDHVYPTATNSVLTQLNQKKATEKIGPPPPIPIKVVNLPFLDDFSKPSYFPDTALWVNGGVFTNYTYPKCPHTLGVATFDGVNAAGMPYNPSAYIYGSYPADTLTSMYISLGKYSPPDSIYLSFYWQAGGWGTPPKTNDTLILELFNGTSWNMVWYHLGYTPSDTDTNFHEVIIPIDSAKYFNNAFRFRFRSYACTAGNLDHWNLDEVYLNQNRNYKDLYQKDVAFGYESPSLLINYEFMPWEQFVGTEAKTNVRLFERNNDTLAHNMTFWDSITGSNGYHASEKPNADNMTPFLTLHPADTLGWWSDPTGVSQWNPPTYLPTSSLTAPTTFDILYVMNITGDFDMWNDTLRFAQIFDNYYAYDDGTAEASYSIVDPFGHPVSLAYQIKLNKTDTLLGVKMFFNYVLANTSSYTFRLAYWTDAGGQPGSTPAYEDNIIYSPIHDSLDKYIYYPFSKPLTVSGTIYVGLVQTSGDSINIGYDWNDNHQNQTFYYTIETGWYYSNYTGSMMMRPVLGNKSYNAVTEVNTSQEEPISLYPNPATNEVRLSKTMNPNTILRIYGSDGRLDYENLHFSGNSVNTSELPAGFYIVEVQPQYSQAEFTRLMISR